MSLPGESLEVAAPAALFLVPDDLGRPTRALDFERGGVALNDASQGLNVTNWRARVSGNDVLISEEPYSSESVLITEPGIIDISLSFDQNMRPTLAYRVGSDCKLYWYDAALPGQTTTTFSGISSPFLALDDKRDVATAIASNDILFFYINGSNLCYRQQRDRFNTERVLRTFAGGGVSIKRVGMGAGLRVQVEVTGIDAS
jgi:hypothetical protein